MKINSESKEQIFKSVLSTVLKLELEKGHLQWKLTDLSRVSGIQRTLIYYYFGSDRESLVNSALSIISKDFFGLPRGKMKRDLVTSLTEARRLIEEKPYILQFYLKWRGTPSPIGKQLRSFETGYKNRLKITFPHLKPEGLDSIFALFFGLVCIPDISPEAIRVSAQSLIQVLPEATFNSNPLS